MFATCSVADHNAPSYVGAETPDVLALLRKQPCMDTDSDPDRKRRIGRRIRELRQQSPYTQEAMAKEIGVSLRGYQAMEGKGAVSYDNLDKIARLHKVELSYFYADGANGDRLDQAIQLLAENQELMRQILRRLEAVAPPLSEAEAIQAYEQAVADGERARRAPKPAAGRRSAGTHSRPASS
jgi:transcriptional regulator with XRE-family HTH domain